jgi:two-component system nitrogen regulation sensor histidine kinase NtrY
MTDVVVRQTDDLRRIVDEFSKFARMPEPETRPRTLVQLLREAVLCRRRPARWHGLRDRSADADVAEIDATMIGQALTNLIKNAAKPLKAFMKEKGRPKPRSRRNSVRVQTLSRRLANRDRDNGIGLPEDRARLFEPYVTTREKGTGLGLPIVKKIIEEHGGTLELLDDAEPIRRRARGRAPGPPLSNCRWRNRREQPGLKRYEGVTDILIVDDERDIRELISDILEDEGFTTRLAGNSDEAWPR